MRTVTAAPYRPVGFPQQYDEVEEVVVWITKEDAPCCRARALPDGRPVIGFCSEACVRRPEHRRRPAIADVIELFVVEERC